MSQNDKQPDLLDWLNLRFERNFKRARVLGSALGFLLILLVLFLIAMLLVTMADFMRAALRLGPYATDDTGAAIRNIGLVLAAFFGAPFLIWRTYVAARQTAIAAESLFNDKINTAATDLAARRMVTRSVGQDGKEVVLTEWQDDLVTRAAAIDRLEGLAEEAMKRDDFAPAQRIARMLSIYVQELSRDPAHAAKPAPEFESRTQMQAWARTLRPIQRTDMERAVQSLGRINPDDATARKAFDPKNIDLRRCNLQGFDLHELNFQEIQLEEAQMQGADLFKAQMQGASIISAQMQGADLKEAQIQGAILSDAQMQGANLFRAQMQGAILSLAQMQGADLLLAQMQGAILSLAQMQGAILFTAQMQGANLVGAQMQGAILFTAQMQGANLRRAQMLGANLEGAQMSEDTVLTAAALRGAAVRTVDDTTLAQLQAHDDWDQMFHQDDPTNFTENWRAFAAALDPPVTIEPDYNRTD